MSSCAPAALAAYLHREGLTGSLEQASSSDLDLAHRLRAGLQQALEEAHDRSGAEPSGLATVLGQLEVCLTWSPTGPVEALATHAEALPRPVLRADDVAVD